MSLTDKDTFALFNNFAKDAATHCVHISVREDEHGWYVFALGLKETHTLQIRRTGSQFTVECWYGKTAEDEYIFDQPVFEQPEHAFATAIAWLKKDLA